MKAHETIVSKIHEFLPLREAQISAFTDSMLLRDTSDGACGLASCLYIEWKGKVYALSCHHVLAESRKYISGAKRLQKNVIDESDTQGVRPFKLIAENDTLDLALFSLEGLDISTIPKSAYELSDNAIDSQLAAENLQTVSFIHAVAGFGAKGTQYEDGLVYMSLPIYSAYGPIVEVSENLIVADFAEKELIELNEKDFPKLKDFQPTQGTRDLSGMSGSGLWVIGGDRFVLLGILLGPTEDNDPETEHKIRFTPIWKVGSWLESLPKDPTASKRMESNG